MPGTRGGYASPAAPWSWRRRSGDCGPLAGRRSTGPGGRVSAATVQPGCFEWERVRPTGGVPREWGSPRPVAGRPRPSTLLLLPLGSTKRRLGKNMNSAARCLLFCSIFKERSRLPALLQFGTHPGHPEKERSFGCWRFARTNAQGRPLVSSFFRLVLWGTQLPFGLRQSPGTRDH